jgi:RNA-directed DNA polymerase
VNGTQQKSQLELNLAAVSTGNAPRTEHREAPKPRSERDKPLTVTREHESQEDDTKQLMEEIVREANLYEALKKVRRNKGSPGIDGMTVGELPGFLRKNWPMLQRKLLEGSYKPKPVKRVEIPKPDGGKRKLGIPTVLDRFVQQAILQVLQKRWDRTFSDSSYGFRPKRSAHQAVGKAQRYVREGCGVVVDIDLEKFFDRVNHDILMSRVARRIQDKRLLKLLRRYLEAGVMESGLVSPTEEGTPQGGPLSPLLSNLMLDDLDKELTRRGHRFVRYADDCNIYVKSLAAGQRVMESVSRFITKKLKLKVNEGKSAVDWASRRSFLGFSFHNVKEPRIRIAPKARERFKDRIRELTSRHQAWSLPRRIRELNAYLRGWKGYFGHIETPSIWRAMDGWIRRRLRALIWRQWKHAKKRYGELRRWGVPPEYASIVFRRQGGSWAMSQSRAMTLAFPPERWKELGLIALSVS